MTDSPQSAPEYYQQSTPPKSNRGLIFGLIGGGLLGLVLIAAGLGFYVWRLSQAQNSIPRLMGADTQLYAAITPNLSAIPGVQRIQTAYPELFLDKDSSNADKQLEELLGVTFKEDIQPWIGPEMAIAVSGLKNFTLEGGSLSGNSAEDLARQAKVAIVLVSTDNTKAQAFLDKQRAGRSEKGQSFDESDYKKVKIYAQRDAENSPIAAFALVSSYVVFASDTAVINAMIDRDASGENTLDDNARYKAVLANLPKTAVGHIFIDGAAMSDSFSAALEQSLNSMSPAQAGQLEEQLQNLKALQGIGASLSVVAEGVQFDTALTFDLTKLNKQATDQLEAVRTPVGDDLLKNISRDAVALMTFKIPSTFKDQVMDTIKAQENGEQSLKEFEDQMGFELEKDLLSWFEGDGSLVLLPGDKLGDVTLPATGYFALRPQDKAAAEAGMQKISAALEKAMGGSPEMAFKEEDIGGTTWNVIKDPNNNQQAMGGYGFAKDDLVIAFGNSALLAAGNGRETPITDNGSFKAVTDKLAKPNGGVIYLSVSNLVDMLRASGAEVSDLADDQPPGKALKPIRAIGAAGEPGIDKDGVARARLFVYISDK